MIAAILISAVVAMPVSAQTFAPLHLSILHKWGLGPRVGVEYRLLERVGFVVAAGSTLFSLEGTLILTYDTSLVIYGMTLDSPLHVNICLGIPDGRIAFICPIAGEISLCASAQVNNRAADRASQIDISMSGKGRALDNVYVQRLWKSPEYDDIYLQNLPQTD